MAELKRVLGFWPILCLSFSSIMGTALYFSPSVAAQISGVSSLIAWILVSLFALYISFFFGELVALYPKAGGVYEFSKQAYNQFTSFIVAWIAWLLGNLNTALMIVAAISYLIPDPSQQVLRLVISITFIIVLNVIAYFGVELSVYAEVVFSIITLAILASIFAPGVVSMDISNLNTIVPITWSAIFVTIFVLTEGFFGFESTTYLSEETKNPEKVIPKAIIIGTVLVAILSILGAVVSFGHIPLQELVQSQAPLSNVFNAIYSEQFSFIFGLGVFLSLIGAAASGILTMPRLILALARDKLFITQFADIHPKFQTPSKAIIFQSIIALIFFLMAFGDYRTLLSLVIPLGIIMYFFIILAVFVLRFKAKDLNRPFKAPFGKAGSIFILLCFIGLMTIWLSTEPNAMSILSLDLSFISVGVPIYFTLMFYYNPDAIIRINDVLATLSLISEKFIIPGSIRRAILSRLGDLRNKTVLEYGCSVGTLTVKLAESVKPYGRVFATDLSKHELEITKRRLAKKGHDHVTVIHDVHQVNRVHPSVPRVDAITSIGMMGYMQDVKKVLNEMRELLPYGGRIVFLDFVDFFKFIPNVDWLTSDELIQKVFTEAGFQVFVTRKRGIFWNYIYVYGIKI